MKPPMNWSKPCGPPSFCSGPLLARLGRAKISLPGGCAIGARPVNLHLKALVSMGADIHLEHGYIHAQAGKLKGADIFFDIPTVTGTENILMAAVTAEGTTTLRNAANEPEIKIWQNAQAMGADIEGAGTDTIVVNGVDHLNPCEHTIIPDRIEAGTFMIAAALTRGDVQVQGCRPEHLTALMEKLRQTGAGITTEDDAIRVRGPESIESVDIKTMPFPGFATDLQAQFMALMTVAKGWSMFRETVFENRFIHVSELRRLGAEIEINGNQALVKGPGKTPFSAGHGNGSAGQRLPHSGRTGGGGRGHGSAPHLPSGQGIRVH
jgi:UDP-N-acetylglucosamine 1-carboxyvinyltransferase